MVFPHAIALGIARILSAGEHGDRALYSVDGKAGIWVKVKRKDSSYLTAVHDGGILALRESVVGGESAYRISEFVRATKVEASLAGCGMFCEWVVANGMFREGECTVGPG